MPVKSQFDDNIVKSSSRDARVELQTFIRRCSNSRMQVFFYVKKCTVES